MPSREMPRGYKYAMEWSALKIIQRTNTWLYRKSGGKFGARLLGAPLLLLTTHGRKTGKPRTLPLVYLEDGRELVVVASKGGSPEHPLWYKNLSADPNVEVQQRDRKRAMVARTASSSERARLWPQLVALYKAYDDYQSWTDREIPLVILSDRN